MQISFSSFPAKPSTIHMQPTTTSRECTFEKQFPFLWFIAAAWFISQNITIVNQQRNPSTCTRGLRHSPCGLQEQQELVDMNRPGWSLLQKRMPSDTLDTLSYRRRSRIVQSMRWPFTRSEHLAALCVGVGRSK